MTQKLTDQFVEKVNQRLEKGAATYGDNAFMQRSVPATLSEIKDELLDVVAYSALLIAKLDALQGVWPPAKPLISKELPVARQSSWPSQLNYPELVLILMRNPGCVIYPHPVGYWVLSTPEAGGLSTSLRLDYGLVLSSTVSEGIESQERDAELLAAYGRGEVYHLPVAP